MEYASLKLILASSSPRRQALLREAGYEFEVVPSSIQEPVLPHDGPVAATAWAEALAYFKARVVAEKYPNGVIIGADTIVTFGDRIIGKPIDEVDARRILSSMFAGTSDVITGLAILCPVLNKRIIIHDRTTLTMRTMEPHELDEYIAGGAWKGKAGAYALQEGGDKFLQAMDGSFSNVVGLPMEKLQEALDHLNRYELDMELSDH